jgi:hypothetical protein
MRRKDRGVKVNAWTDIQKKRSEVGEEPDDVTAAGGRSHQASSNLGVAALELGAERDVAVLILLDHDWSHGTPSRAHRITVCAEGLFEWRQLTRPAG